MLKFMIRLIVILIAIASGALVGLTQELVLRGQMKKEAETVGLDVSQLNMLVASGSLPEAGKLVDDAMAHSSRPELLWGLSAQIANRSIRFPEHIDSGIDRFCVLIDVWSSQPELPPVTTRDIGAALETVTNRWLRQNRPSDAIAIVEKTVDKARKLGSKGEVCRVALSRQLATLLQGCQREDDAKSVLRLELEALSERLSESSSNRREFAITAMALGMFEDPTSLVERDKQVRRVNEELVLVLDSDKRNVEDLATYMDLRKEDLFRHLTTSHKQASAIALELRHRLDAFSLAPESREFRALDVKRKELASIESRIQAAKGRSDLVGTVSPDFRSETFIGMEPATLASLRGQVVLLDFFSMNCGPCIASFSVLNQLQSKYAKSGLRIIGITDFQNFVWDAQTQSPILSVDVPREVELEALRKFREHHRLAHGFVVLADPEFSRALFVKGVPQVLLLDRQGRIQFIHVGSSRESEKELEEFIRRLTQTE